VSNTASVSVKVALTFDLDKPEAVIGTSDEEGRTRLHEAVEYGIKTFVASEDDARISNYDLSIEADFTTLTTQR
jgi:hypothetical protein